jgi:hypothetical protein
MAAPLFLLFVSSRHGTHGTKPHQQPRVLGKRAFVLEIQTLLLLAKLPRGLLCLE